MKCLICGSEEKEMLTQLCDNMDIMGPFFEGEKSSIVACKECGHVYVDINVEQEAFTKYYSSEYSKSLSYYEVFGESNATIYYQNIVSRIERYVDKGSNILEIGGGIGELAAFFQEKGFYKITVMEPSPRCKKICQEKGIPVILSDCMSLDESLIEKYDFIIINHTLEHVLRFDKILEHARAMLKCGGHIYIEVPNAAEYLNADFVPYWFFTYEHVWHMSLFSFNNVAASFGFCIDEKNSYLKCNSYYVMYAVLNKKDENNKKICYSAEAKDGVVKYIEKCTKSLKPVIDVFKKNREPLILWGVGTSTAQLLNKNFDECNIKKLIDSNPYRQGVTYNVAGHALKIEDPSSIKEEDGTILILPLMYDKSIRKQIKKMKLKNEMKSLIESYKREEDL